MGPLEPGFVPGFFSPGIAAIGLDCDATGKTSNVKRQFARTD
jgi:hypothetical protein